VQAIEHGDEIESRLGKSFAFATSKRTRSATPARSADLRAASIDAS